MTCLSQAVAYTLYTGKCPNVFCVLLLQSYWCASSQRWRNTFSTACSQTTFWQINASSGGKPPVTHPLQKPQGQNNWWTKTWLSRPWSTSLCLSCVGHCLLCISYHVSSTLPNHPTGLIGQGRGTSGDKHLRWLISETFVYLDLCLCLSFFLCTFMTFC